MSLPTVTIDGREVMFSLHACRRWHRRLRPSLKWEPALRDLETEVAEKGAISRRRPRRIEFFRMRHKLVTVAWLTLENEAVAFPLVNHGEQLLATTCIVKEAP